VFLTEDIATCSNHLTSRDLNDFITTMSKRINGLTIINETNKEDKIERNHNTVKSDENLTQYKILMITIDSQ
jgi:hypothetical protein